MRKPIWVLLYLIDSDKWWPETAPHDPNFFPDVHTYCFETEAEAVAHQRSMTKPSAYRVKKSYLQTAETDG